MAPGGPGSIYIVGDRGRAGSGLLTVAVDDLETQLAELAESVPVVESTAGPPRRASVTDLDGNKVTFFESR